MNYPVKELEGLTFSKSYDYWRNLVEIKEFYDRKGNKIMVEKDMFTKDIPATVNNTDLPLLFELESMCCANARHNCWPSNKYLSQKLHESTRNIQNKISKLKLLHFISVKEKKESYDKTIRFIHVNYVEIQRQLELNGFDVDDFRVGISSTEYDDADFSDDEYAENGLQIGNEKPVSVDDNNSKVKIAQFQPDFIPTENDKIYI